MIHTPANEQPLIPIGEVLTAEETDNSVTFRCTNAIVNLAIREAQVIRIRLTFTDTIKQDASFIVIPSKRAVTPSFEFIEEADGWRIVTSRLQISISRSPCRLTFFDLNGHQLNADTEPTGMSGTHQQIRCSKILPITEHYYGFGLKGKGLDKRGSKMTMWNHYQLYEPDSDPLSINVPFFVAIRQGLAYGLFVDSPAKSVFDMGATDSKTYSFTVDDSQLDYYFIYGPDPKEVLYRFSQLTGTMPLPPRWTLGYHQSRFSYPDEKRIREVANEFRRRKIPCDAIWFDIHYLDEFCVFTWNHNAFPDPNGLIMDLAANGFQSITVIDPGIKQDKKFSVYREGLHHNYFLSKEDGTLFVGTVFSGPSVFPDFLKPQVRRWWGDLHEPLIKQGVAAIWNDLNEPQLFIYREYAELAEVIQSDGQQTYPHPYVHNLYANLHNQATFEGLLRLRPNHRPWILSRAGWAGVQRYAAVWTADCTSNWEHLQVTIPMLLNLGMAGIPFIGADVGGWKNDCTPALFARWLQMAVFTPFCRSHTNMGTVDQEPWAFGMEVEEISRRFITWRYRLLPYLYNLAYEASLTGLPIIRPLILEYPEDEKSHTIDDEFLLGSSLLIAPVLCSDTNEREIYLPPDDWIDPHNQQCYRGPTTITVPAPLEHCPTLVRQGSIIPLYPVVQHTGEPINQLHLDIYPLSETAIEFQLYEDDGNTLAYQDGKATTTQYWCYAESNGIHLDILDPQGEYEPAPREYHLSLRTISTIPTQVLLNSHPLPQLETLHDSNRSRSGWLFQQKDHTVFIRFPDRRKRTEVRILL